MGTASSFSNASTVALICQRGPKSRVTCFWMAAATEDTSANEIEGLSGTRAICDMRVLMMVSFCELQGFLRAQTWVLLRRSFRDPKDLMLRLQRRVPGT